MTSVPSFIKQIPSDSRNFVPLSSLIGVILGLNEATNVLTPAAWAQGNTGVYQAGITATPYSSSINGLAAGKLRDMGKTYVSSGRTFRKVQLIAPVPSTFGVAGYSEAQAPTSDYLTGYIELGWEGQGTPAPVARTA
jgi:hypothetical protein